MNLEFIAELNEARMYKGTDTIVGKSAGDLAKVAFLMFMMLEILRSEDTPFAKKYAGNTVAYENFSAMRTNASDLHNLLSILNNQDKFSDKITTNSKISVPVLQIKRFLRDIDNGRTEHGLDRAFFKTLEDYFKITDSSCKEVRRAVADWNFNSPTEKNTVRTQIKNLLQLTNQQNDLLMHFRNKLHG